jgi:hypothetical protein
MANINSQLTPEQEADIYGLDAITVLDPDSDKIEQPVDIKIPLKYHQLSLINYCQHLETSTEHPFIFSETTEKGNYDYEVSSKNGIIGDIVGSGKTLSILGLIASTKTKSINTPEFENKDCSSNYCRIKCVSQPLIQSGEVNITMVVVPHTIFKQWDKTVSEQSNLKCIRIHNSKTLNKFSDMRYKILFPEEGEDDSDEAPINTGYSYKTWDGKALEEYDMMLVSSTFYNKLMNIISYDNFKIKRIVFDEADSIKIQGSYMIKNSFVWFVTSTFGALLNPGGIRMWRNAHGELSQNYSYSSGFTERVFINGINSKGFIKHTLDGLSYTPRKFRKFFVVKNRDDFVSNAFNLIPVKEQIIKCKMPLSLRVLSSSASAEVLAFINAGDIQGAVESLDCDKVSEEGLIGAVTKDLQSRLHNKNLELEMKSKMNWSSDTVKKDALVKINIKIAEIQSKIENIKSKLNDSSHCNICFDPEITCPTITPCCNTKFCFECITKWLAGNGSGSPNLSCPFCRAEMSPTNLIVIDDNAAAKIEEKGALEEELDKLETLKNILSERCADKSQPRKILIFSEYFRAFDKMTEVLGSIGIKYSKVIGTTNTVNKKIREYKSFGEDSIDCLLLNAEYCASGLNLENTTDIIITHKMTNEKMTQIVGRGQRPGRVGQLNVWKLFYETEM